MNNADTITSFVVNVKIQWESPKKSASIRLIFIGITLTGVPKAVDRHITMYYSTCDWHRITNMAESNFEIYHNGVLIT